MSEYYTYLPSPFEIWFLICLEVDWPAGSRDPPVSSSPALGLQVYTTMLDFFRWVLMLAREVSTLLTELSSHTPPPPFWGYCNLVQGDK